MNVRDTTMTQEKTVTL